MNNYNWNMPLIPGTIVCAKYNKFDGTETTGIFCVIYDEQLDSNVLTRKNVLAVKLSTQLTLVSNYSVDIDMERNSFLLSKSIVCCSKIHILHKEQQVYKVLGKLDKATYDRVFKSYMRFAFETQRQLIDRL
jgi:hypothetical protein